MGGRYWISGAQIGMLKAFVDLKKNDRALEVLDEIEEKQYVCEAEEFEKLCTCAKAEEAS